MYKEDLNLRREIYRKDIKRILKWMDNSKVTEYLNELPFIKNALYNLLKKNTCEIFTHHINNNGRFYMVETNKEGTVGYVKLSKSGEEAEVVLAVGNIEEWGKGIGKRTLWEVMRVAFFEIRLTYLTAKIHHMNKRSQIIFKKLGFDYIKDLGKEGLYILTQEKFIEDIC